METNNRNTSRNSHLFLKKKALSEAIGDTKSHVDYCVSHEPDADISQLIVETIGYYGVVKFLCSCSAAYKIEISRDCVIDIHIAEETTTYVVGRDDYVKFTCPCGKKFQIFGPDVKLMHISYTVEIVEDIPAIPEKEGEKRCSCGIC